MTEEIINDGRLCVKNGIADTDEGDIVFTLKKGTGKYIVTIIPEDMKKK
jgi:hypothetical protein